jgi:hypothetical protein
MRVLRLTADRQSWQVDVNYMKVEYRIKEATNKYTPQRRLLIFWLSLTSPQPTLAAARAIIRTLRMSRHPFLRE